MKKNLFFGLVMSVIIFASCSKKTTTPDPVVSDNDTSASNLSYTGIFTSVGGESVTGSSDIYNNDGKNTLVLNNFSASAGPDLHVYLSQESTPIHFIDLGKLRANSGTQVYEIVGMPDFSLYTFVLIHCQQYNHVFGVSALK